MADEPFASLHLSLMQDILPVGLAVLERARRGGPKMVVEAFQTTNDPLVDLRTEGECAAQLLRERLDEIKPGLGNPVMSVKVEVDDNLDLDDQSDDHQELITVLDSINIRLSRLEDFLSKESTGSLNSRK